MTKYGYIRLGYCDEDLTFQADEILKNGVNLLNLVTEIPDINNKPLNSALYSLIDRLEEDDIVIVSSLDRLAISLKRLFDVILMINEKKAFIYSLKDGIITPDFIKYTILMKEFHEKTFKERNDIGIEMAKRDGRYKFKGRKFDDNNIEKIKSLINEGISIAQIARENNCSRTTVYRYLDMLNKGNNSLAVQRSIEVRKNKKT